MWEIPSLVISLSVSQKNKFKFFGFFLNEQRTT